MHSTIFIPIWLLLATIARSQDGSSYGSGTTPSNSTADPSSYPTDSSYSSTDDNGYGDDYNDDGADDDEDDTDTGFINYTTLDPSIQSAAEKYNNDLQSYATADPTRDIFYEIYEAASYPATQTPDPLAELAASFAEGMPAPSGALNALPTSLRPAAESFLNAGASIAASDLAGNPALASAVRSYFEQDLTDYSYTTMTGDVEDDVSSTAALTAALTTAPSTTTSATGTTPTSSSVSTSRGNSTTLSTRATPPSSTTSVLAAPSSGASTDNARMQYGVSGALTAFLAFVALL